MLTLPRSAITRGEANLTVFSKATVFVVSYYNEILSQGGLCGMQREIKERYRTRRHSEIKES